MSATPRATADPGQPRRARRTAAGGGAGRRGGFRGHTRTGGCRARGGAGVRGAGAEPDFVGAPGVGSRCARWRPIWRLTG